MLLLEQQITKKDQGRKKVTELDFEDGKSKNYIVEVI